MKTVLVTGSNGFIGSNLVRKLLQLGYNVRAFHRANSNITTLKGIDVNHVYGDILDINSLEKAIHECDTVFHTAAVVSFWKGHREEQYKINIGGTRNVVRTCLKFGIAKLIHTSSVATLGYRTDRQLIDENSTYNWGKKIAYRYTKHLAEIEVLKGVQQGLNAVIVNPSVIIGAGDTNFHGGSIIRDIKLRRIPAYPKGGINLVSIDDVVSGEIAAVFYGKTGERYILGGINLTHKEVFTIAANVVDGKAPTIKAPTWFVKTTAKIFDTLGGITKTRPPLTSDLASAAGLYNWYSIEKAKRELNYSPTSIEDAMKNAYMWYVENGML